ncbi:MAG: hypothetical protein JOY71_21620 [Acetobacteraceae bacterium]|nr:hypothetical protein [Acetobacteraceae bacterium]MBV8524682.1 hypothetical protein [Acetobacteraceae bacterium]MBV8588504.1 hypothetical protein [Acetobacteraceae bacterium]
MRLSRLVGRLAFVLAIASGSCRLIDQTTFAPEAEPPPTPAQIAATTQAGNRPALITIRYSVANPSYQDLLAQTMRTAEARRPGLEYDVVGIAPAAGDPATQAQSAQQATNRAAAVMRAMMADGVRDRRIHLAARTDPSVTIPEVRVYVR